jgi:Zn-dependent peptidase ImmA (M78 family)
MGAPQRQQSLKFKYYSMIRRKLISQTVTRLLQEGGIDGPIVDVTALAESEGAIVVSEPEANDFSGFLYQSGKSAPIIGVNSKHSPNRRRFTIAHELGHLLLHSKRGVHLDQAVVQMRGEKAAAGTDEHEIEANRFAAELLMPQDFLQKDLASMGDSFADDEKAIAQLAKRYGVSSQAMAIRLSTLGLVWM